MSHDLTGAQTRALLDEHTQAIVSLKSRIARDFYEVGVRLLDIQHRELWAGRYDSYTHYLREGLDVSEASAGRYTRIARHFNAEIAGRYGSSKLLAVLSWLSATTPDEQPGDVFAASIRIRGDRGRFELVSMNDASAKQVREATRLLEETRQAARRVSGPVAEQLDALRQAIPSRTGAEQSVSARLDSDGEVLLDFRRIELSALPAFIEALREHMG